MAFFKARIKNIEITKDSHNTIMKIYVRVEMQDGDLVETKEFDYVVDGSTLDEIRGDLKIGVRNLIKQQIKQKYPEWISETQKLVETTNKLTPAQIATQFIGEITELD